MKKEFNKLGYEELPKTKENYGNLIRKAPKLDVPIFSLPSSYKRSNLTYIGDYGLGYNDDSQLVHAGAHAGQLYMTSDGRLVDIKRDYNNYGRDPDQSKNQYSDFVQFLANSLDKIGTPVIVSSGYQDVKEPMFNPRDINTNPTLTINDIMDSNSNLYINDQIVDLVKNFVKKNNMQNIDGKWISTLPEVEVITKRKKK